MLTKPIETLDNKDYSAIKKKMDLDYQNNSSIWQTFWTESNIDVRLEAGDVSVMGDLQAGALPTNRNNFYFNRVRPIINMVSGHQRRNRKSSVVVPLENADQQTADQFTKILLGIYKREGIYETISDAFHGGLITGMTLLHVYMDYTNDPVNGDIKCDSLAYNEYFIDPYFRKTNFSDCNFIWRRSYLTRTEAAALMPNEYEAIMELSINPTGTPRDGKFQYMPEATGQTQSNKVSYDEYYYRSYRKQKLLIDKNTGESFEITKQTDLDIQEFLNNYPETEVIEQNVPTVRLAIVIQDQVFYDGPNNLGIDTFPFVPVLAYYNSMMPYFYNRIQGMCRSLRDPQVLLNRRILLSADMLESQVNSGWIFKENAILDVKHLMQTGQGKIIPLKEEAQMSDIMPIIPPQIPPSFFQLQETFSQELMLVSGVNEELMGSAIDDKAGILSVLRQGAGLTTLQPVFDKLDFAQNLLGALIMKIVQNNYTIGKIKNLLEGQDPAPLFYNKAFGKYHCNVEAGLNTETQKQMQFAQLMSLRELGVAIPDIALLESATIQDKPKIIAEVIKQKEQATQIQMQQIQAQMALVQAQTELAKARSYADMGLYNERTSRVEENRALAIQKLSEANKNNEQATLEKLKIVRELEDMDLAHLERLLTLAQGLKDREMMNVGSPQGVNEKPVVANTIDQSNINPDSGLSQNSFEV